jgi:hypothetical protein
LKHFRTFIIAIATAAVLPAASVNLSNAFTFQTDGSGTWSGGITSTTGCCQLLTVEPDTFSSGAGNVSLPYTMSNGAHTIYFETGDWTSLGLIGGINLFFNGDLTPGISAYVPATFDKTDFSQTFLADSSSSTPDLIYPNIVAGSGSLSYSSGGATITLTGLQWVGAGGGGNPYDPTLTVVRADFTVSDSSGIPEPGTFVLFGGALIAIGGTRYRLLLRRR